MLRLLAVLLLCIQTGAVFAHARNNAFIDLVQTTDRLIGALQLRLEDLQLITNVDVDQNQQLTWGEVKLARPAIAAYVTEHLHLEYPNSPCVLTLGEFQIQQLAGGSYLFIPLNARCPLAEGRLEVNYSLLFAVDAAHRGLFTLETDRTSAVFVFAPGQETFILPEGEQSTLSYMLIFVEEGIWHIWTGYDHLLFLLALLIPLFGTGKSSNNELKALVIKVLKLVTAFTIAHSITLIATSIYQPAFSPSIIETLIAISVVFAGINMLWPLFDKGNWRIAFSFGLLHGLGFATALSGLALPADYFFECLLSFNLGVELGQLAIVLLCTPLILLLSRQTYYRTWALPILAIAVITCSVGWTLERALEI